MSNGSLASYRLTVDALTDFLPLDVTLDVKTVRHDTLTRAQRCEDELGEEQRGFVDGCQREGDGFPVSDGAIIVGIDGGYVRNWEVKRRHFEVIVGKSMRMYTQEEMRTPPASVLALSRPLMPNPGSDSARFCSRKGSRSISRSRFSAMVPIRSVISSAI
jgi:hypothetical protein